MARVLMACEQAASLDILARTNAVSCLLLTLFVVSLASLCAVR